MRESTASSTSSVGGVAGVLRRFPARSLQEKRGTPFEPDSGLAELARSVGRVLGLSVYGVDVLVGTNGPVVIDVNAMPGFKGWKGLPSAWRTSS